VPVVAALHFVWQRWCDRHESDIPPDEALAVPDEEGDADAAPAAYALLPILPLVLLFVFSPLVVTTIRLDVVTAMLISLAIGMACESLRHRSLRKALAGITVFFRGMGEIFSSVVTLIVAAEVFAMGIKATGLIGSLVAVVEGNALGSGAMAVTLVLLLGVAALLTGSDPGSFAGCRGAAHGQRQCRAV